MYYYFDKIINYVSVLGLKMLIDCFNIFIIKQLSIFFFLYYYEIIIKKRLRCYDNHKLILSVRDENDKENDDIITGHGCMCNRCYFIYYSDHKCFYFLIVRDSTENFISVV